MSNARNISKLGNAPAFSAYNATAQSVTNSVNTKVNLDTEEFDYGSCFASGRFTPNVPGLYQINAQVLGSGTSTVTVIANLYKNGAAAQVGSFGAANSSINAGSSVATLIYLNGTTDYVELYTYINATSPVVSAPSLGSITRMSGFLVKAL